MGIGCLPIISGVITCTIFKDPLLVVTVQVYKVDDNC
jgi:hypothetical protein